MVTVSDNDFKSLRFVIGTSSFYFTFLSSFNRSFWSLFL